MSLQSRNCWTATWCWTSSSWTRVYLNGCVPSLQVGRQVVAFLYEHLEMKIASAVFEQIGTQFQRAIARFAK